MEESTGKKEKRSILELAANAAVWLVAGIVFFPMTKWLFQTSASQGQVLHALMVLGGAGGFLVFEKRKRLHLIARFTKNSWWGLLLSFCFAMAAMFLKWPVLLLVAYCFFLSSGVLFLFGPRAARAANALLAAFFVFLLLAINLAYFDWPLRAASANCAAYVLDLIGFSTRLILQTGTEPKLLLMVGSHVFEVAAECNGFGLATASILLGVLLAVYVKSSWTDKGLLLIAASSIGFGFNVIRIVIICILAPLVGKAYYYVMHEIVGATTFWCCLALIWVAGTKWARKDGPNIGPL